MSELTDAIAAERTEKGRMRIKAEALKARFDGEWNENLSITRGQWMLRFPERPTLVRDREGNIVGIEVFVRVYRNGNEVKVDNRRRLINPPMLVPDGTFTTVTTQTGDRLQVPNYTENPREALLRALVDSIQSRPNPAGWVAP